MRTWTSIRVIAIACGIVSGIAPRGVWSVSTQFTSATESFFSRASLDAITDAGTLRDTVAQFASADGGGAAEYAERDLLGASSDALPWAWSRTFSEVDSFVDSRVSLVTAVRDDLEEVAPSLSDATADTDAAAALALCNAEDLTAACRSSLAGSDRFAGTSVSMDFGGYKLAPGVEREADNTERAFRLLRRALLRFRDQLGADAAVRWQYFGSSRGIVGTYPAFEWTGAADYDPRLRPWYLAASAPPREMVIVFSAEVGATPSKTVVIDLLRSLSSRDTVALVAVSASGVDYSLCRAGFLRATGSNVALLIERVERVSSSAGASGAELALALAAAVDLFAGQAPGTTDPTAPSSLPTPTPGSSTIAPGALPGGGTSTASGAGCARALAVVYEGTSALGTSSQAQALVDVLSGGGVRVSAFVARDTSRASSSSVSSSSVSLARTLACGSGGIYSAVDVGAEESVRSQLSSFHQLWAGGVAAGLDAESSERTVWTSPYEDSFGLGAIVTVAAPVYDKSINPPAFLGVVATDIIVADIARPVRLAAPFHAPEVYPILVDGIGGAIVHPHTDPARIAAYLAGTGVAGPPDVNAVEGDAFQVVRELMYGGLCPEDPRCAGAIAITGMSRSERHPGGVAAVVTRTMRYYVRAIGSGTGTQQQQRPAVFFGIIAVAEDSSGNAPREWRAARTVAEGNDLVYPGTALLAARESVRISYVAGDRTVAGQPIDTTVSDSEATAATGGGFATVRGYAPEYVYIARHAGTFTIGPGGFEDPSAAVAASAAAAASNDPAAHSAQEELVRRAPSDRARAADDVRSASALARVATLETTAVTGVDAAFDAAILSNSVSGWVTRFRSEESPCFGTRTHGEVTGTAGCVGTVRRAASTLGVEVVHPALYPRDGSTETGTTTTATSDPPVLPMAQLSYRSTARGYAGALRDPRTEPWFAAHFSAARLADIAARPAAVQALGDPYVLTPAPVASANWDGRVTLSTSIAVGDAASGVSTSNPSPSFVVAAQVSAAVLYDSLISSMPVSTSCGRLDHCLVTDLSGRVLLHPALGARGPTSGTTPRFPEEPMFLYSIERDIARVMIATGALRAATSTTDGIGREKAYLATLGAGEVRVLSAAAAAAADAPEECPRTAGASEVQIAVHRPVGADVLVIVSDHPFYGARPWPWGSALPETTCTPLDPSVSLSLSDAVCTGEGPVPDPFVYEDQTCVAFTLSEDDTESIFRDDGNKCSTGISRTTEIVLIAIAIAVAVMAVPIVLYLRKFLLRRRIDKSFRVREDHRKKVADEMGIEYPDAIVPTGPASVPPPQPQPQRHPQPQPQPQPQRQQHHHHQQQHFHHHHGPPPPQHQHQHYHQTYSPGPHPPSPGPHYNHHNQQNYNHPHAAGFQPYPGPHRGSVPSPSPHQYRR